MADNIYKIIEGSINYFKFFKEHRPYGITKTFEIDEPETDEIISPSDESVNIETVADKPKTKVIPAKEPDLFPEEWESIDSISELDNAIKNCTKCSLAKTRTNLVFGAGNPDAEIMIIGEAPGADEDIQGKPFVGRAGQLLTDILKAIEFSRDDVFICNVLKCRPPGNRNPQPEEISKCRPYLNKQISIIKPKLILALGTFAAQTLLNTKEPLGKLRGKFFEYFNEGNLILLLVTYHPAALLRNPNWKKPTWEDVQLFKKKYVELKNNI